MIKSAHRELTIDEAAAILRTADLDVLKSREFGDYEVTWWQTPFDRNADVANGYFGYSGQEINVLGTTFKGPDAYYLLDWFKRKSTAFN